MMTIRRALLLGMSSVILPQILNWWLADMKDAHLGPSTQITVIISSGTVAVLLGMLTAAALIVTAVVLMVGEASRNRL